MIALSTSFAAGRFTDGEKLMAALEGFEVTGIELEYRINEKVFHQMKPLLMESLLPVVSIHNFFPVPGIIKSGRGSGDLFALSHPDREERLSAIKWTQRTIEHANDLEVGVVVLHCGRVDVEPGIDQLHGYFQTHQIESEEAQGFISKAKEYRDRHKQKYIDGLFFSLDRLLNVAEGYHVTLALENRYHYHELPGPDDFPMIFNEFDGAPLGYWHDTGHAHVNDNLTIIGADELLSMNRDRLVGIHLHDAVGLNDHLPPGTGDIDFLKIMSQLSPNTIKVIELKPGTEDADVAEGIKHIAKFLEHSTTSDKGSDTLTD